MALTNISPESVQKALQDGLKLSGIESAVSFESIPQTRLYRFVAVSGQFDAMPYSDR